MKRPWKPSGVTVQNRDIRFDVLRVVGLLYIILAHKRPPELLMQLRSFYVPLLVLVSGAVFGFSSQNKKLRFWVYPKKRTLRIVAPTWTFLVFFFLPTCIVFWVHRSSYPFSSEYLSLLFLN